MRPAHLSIAAMVALSLAACEQPKQAVPVAEPAAAQANQAEATGDVGNGIGVVQAISPQGDAVTIEHGPIDGIGMDAMTMQFGAMSAVDLSGLQVNDPVAFRVKQGRDNSYRITAICNTVQDGADCLAGIAGE